MLTSGVCLLFYLFILACSGWIFNCIKVDYFLCLIKMNRLIFKNSFRDITWKAQRSPLDLSHVQSPLLLPFCTQVIQGYNQWPYSDPLLSPKVRVSHQVHTCCHIPRGFGQIEDGECSGSKVWAEDFHCPKTYPVLYLPFPSLSSLPSGCYWSLHCLHTLTFPESHVTHRK